MEQLTLEEDQLQDHEHHITVTDPGHAHPYIDQTFFDEENGYDQFHAYLQILNTFEDQKWRWR